HIFRHLFLSWQRRRVSEPGVAIERRSRYPIFYEQIAAGHARAMDNRFYCNNCGRTGEYLTHGPCGRARTAGRYWPAFWPEIVTSTTRCAEERGHRRHASDCFDADCAGAGDSFGATA